jgi:hypothetical protein
MSTRQAPRSLFACSSRSSAYSCCSGVGAGNDPALPEGVMDHRPANSCPPPREILVHHDHIDRSTDPSDSVTQTDSLRDAVLNITLNDQEVQVTVGREFTARCRPEQDHLGRGSCSPRKAQASQFDRLLRGHDEDRLPAAAAIADSDRRKRAGRLSSYNGMPCACWPPLQLPLSRKTAPSCGARRRLAFGLAFRITIARWRSIRRRASTTLPTRT